MRRYIIIALAVVPFLVSCAKDGNKAFPYSVTVQDVASCQARLVAGIQTDAPVELPFIKVWIADNPNFVDERWLTANTAEGGRITILLDQLAPERKYYYKTRMIIDGENYDSEVMSFTTGSLPEGAVDLGLSIKWASVNLGASKIESYGTPQAWTEEDPVPQTLGGKWRRPTREEFDELITHTNIYYVDYKGVWGRTFTNIETGNSIFLPVEKSTITNGILFLEGIYWTSQKNADGDVYAFPMSNNYYPFLVNESVSSQGVIRPVLSE